MLTLWALFRQRAGPGLEMYGHVALRPLPCSSSSPLSRGVLFWGTLFSVRGYMLTSSRETASSGRTGLGE